MRMTIEDFQRDADVRVNEARGGRVQPIAYNVNDDGMEFFQPHPHPALEPIRIRVTRSPRFFDHALTSDEVKRGYETRRITVNKTTHRIRFENETESSVRMT